MNKQNKIIVGVVALILALTIGYAVFSQSLNINGTAKAQGNLDIVFSEVGEISPHGTNTPTATITENGRKLELSEITLDYPTAYVDIPVTIINNGTVDGILESITVENLETDDIKVTINGIENNQVVKIYKANDDTTKVKATVRVEWLDKTDTKTESVKDIVVTLNAKQLVKEVVTTASSSSDNKCTTFTKKETYEVGDVIAFCNTNTNKSEDFYVIKDNGDTVTALAKYNLMVGNSIDLDTQTLTEISNSEEDYGLQSELTKMKFTEEDMPTSTTLYGIIAFANKDENNKTTDGTYLGYWTDATNYALDKPLEAYGTSYPADVYDSNSILYEHVQKYQTYFTSTINKTTAKMRLITYNELVGLGCSKADGTCTKDFVYKGLSYWSASARDYRYVWDVDASGSFEDNSFWSDDGLGVRPVITINKSEI